ncbi:MAG: hypothetical protein LBU40_06310, partial [Methanobrevibacter sp.]|nr:hypothetical protein [Methanobrevibacter sp.]
YDRIKNIFKELQELPEKQHITPSELFKETEFINEKINEKFKAVAREYNTQVLDKSPIPKKTNRIFNKFYSFFKEMNQPKNNDRR